MKKYFLAGILVLSLLPCTAGPGIALYALETEMQRNPTGVSEARPRFSWKIASAKQNVAQVAYHIQVARSEKDLSAAKNLMWDSGRIGSDQSVLVAYGGRPLESGKQYFWRVTVWTNTGDKSTGNIQRWSMALRNDSDWKAAWIGIDDTVKVENNRTTLPARYLRKEFGADGKPARATLYISGVGSSVCYINGRQVGEDVFGPVPTYYDVSVPYLTYDVTELIRKGDNAIGVILGNGRFLTVRPKGTIDFGLPRLIAQLHLEYPDGRSRTIVTDSTWTATNQGPITANNEYDGETYDARLELGEWTTGGYDTSGWQPAAAMEPPKGKLTAQLSPGVRVMDELTPRSVTATEDGRYIIDFGQNFAGRMQVRLKGRKDKPVTMRFAETLKPGGTELYTDNLRSARATDVYIPAADGAFVWEPLFVYHGFRYAEVSGLDYAPSPGDFTGKVVHDYMETIGRFDCSDEILNRIYQNAYWGIRSNYQGMPVDCPQRDEREAWLGDHSTGAYSQSFLFDNVLLFKKWLADIEDSMRADGCISVISPRFRSAYHENVTWPSAFFNVADMIYRQFGDDSAIKKHYPAMKRWVKYTVESQMRDHILTKDRYGDWCVPPESPELIFSRDPRRKTNGEVLSTTVFYGILGLMQKFAAIGGFRDDAEGYRELAAGIKKAYNDKYFDAETSRYDNNSVTANLLSLRLGLVPEGYEEKVFSNIVDKIETEYRGHVATGVVGIQHFMRGLTENGGGQLAYRIACNRTYPSWGYMVDKGATTIWELWNGDTADPAMNSHNHVMLLGDLLIWYYEYLAGIKSDYPAAGFKKIRMAPVFPEGLHYVDASYDSPYGVIRSRWKRTGDMLEWHITIPCNTTAVVELPAAFRLRPEPGSPGVRSVAEEHATTRIELGSGTYDLKSQRN